MRAGFKMPLLKYCGRGEGGGGKREATACQGVGWGGAGSCLWLSEEKCNAATQDGASRRGDHLVKPCGVRESEWFEENGHNALWNDDSTLARVITDRVIIIKGQQWGGGGPGSCAHALLLQYNACTRLRTALCAMLKCSSGAAPARVWPACVGFARATDAFPVAIRFKRFVEVP